MTDQTTYTALAARYDRAAPRWWRKLERMSYPDAFHELVGHLPDSKVNTVLDAGTGCGDLAIAYLDTHPRPEKLDLLDISADMLQVAKDRIDERATPNLLHQSLETLPAAQYDLILCAHVIEHCPNPLSALRTLRRALRPNGRLLLAVSRPHFCTVLLQLIWHHHAFRPTKVERMLSIAGFRTIKIHPFSTGIPARLSSGYLATI